LLRWLLAIAAAGQPCCSQGWPRLQGNRSWAQPGVEAAAGGLGPPPILCPFVSAAIAAPIYLRSDVCYCAHTLGYCCCRPAPDLLSAPLAPVFGGHGQQLARSGAGPRSPWRRGYPVCIPGGGGSPQAPCFLFPSSAARAGVGGNPRPTLPALLLSNACCCCDIVSFGAGALLAGARTCARGAGAVSAAAGAVWSVGV
jgi:hypothetical protein